MTNSKKIIYKSSHDESERVETNKARRYMKSAGWTLWIVVAFFLTSFVAAVLFYVLKQYGLANYNNLSTTASFWLDAMIYVVMFAIVMSLPYFRWRKKNRTKNLKGNSQTVASFLGESVGLTRWPNWNDLKYFLAGLPVFYLLVIILSMVAAVIVGSETMNQAQDVGFKVTENGFEIALIFVALVIVAPLFEEMMMRGFLFGKLRGYLSFVPAAILTSLVFALAHGQLNVGLMTFILSMFSCRMREKTGVIWGGLFLHMTVNLVAFSVRFLGVGS